MRYNRVIEAVFLERPNRFVAIVMIDGEPVRVHVKNTGRCRELLQKGAKVFLECREDGRTARKTDYSLVTVEKKEDTAGFGSRLVNIDSQAPNKVVGEALSAGRIALPGIGSPLFRIRPEMTFGTSRFDFFVEDETGGKAFIEVKGVTLEDGGIVRFPDAPTERGVKHIRELCLALERGFAAYIIFVIQMERVLRFEPNDETHAAFGAALREAQKRGVAILAYDCIVEKDGMTLGKPVPVILARS